jgi:hypothetical protein
MPSQPGVWVLWRQWRSVVELTPFLPPVRAHAPHQAQVHAAVQAEVLGGSVASVAARALRYTRDRVCVPRDMGLGAARQLRCYLHTVAEMLDPGQARFPALPIPTRDRRDVDPTRFGVQKI